MRDAQLPGLNEVSSHSTEQDLVRWLDAELLQTYLVKMMPTWFTPEHQTDASGSSEVSTGPGTGQGDRPAAPVRHRPGDLTLYSIHFRSEMEISGSSEIVVAGSGLQRRANSAGVIQSSDEWGMFISTESWPTGTRERCWTEGALQTERYLGTARPPSDGGAGPRARTLQPRYR